MTKALDVAFKISHYAGQLFNIATNPDIAKGSDYAAIAIREYAQPDPTKVIISGDVPSALTHLFKTVSQIEGAVSDSETRAILTKSLEMLDKVLGMDEPATGPSQSFTNLKSSLTAEMAHIHLICA